MPPRPRILITRTRHQASALADRLEALGAETVVLPTIELAPPSSYHDLDAAIEALSDPGHDIDWLIFTSGNAVNAFHERCCHKGIEVHPRRIAVIGPATLKEVEEAAIKPLSGPVLMPGKYTAEDLAAEILSSVGPPPKNFLLIRAQEARDVIPTALETAGHSVTIAPAYRNIIPSGTIPALQRLFALPDSYPEIITFTSSSTARNLLALLDSAGIILPPGIILASIGPITSATLRELGHEPTMEASEPTIDSLVSAIAASLTH
jgi:uroporphyrinogen-III synthase